MKKLLKIVGSIVVVLVVLAVVAFLGRNLIAAAVIRTGATAALGVKVDVSSVDLDLSTPGVKLVGLEVGNPEGYAPPHALTAGLIDVRMNSAETTAQKIVVDSVTLDKLGVWFIKKGDTNNISQVLSSLGGAGGKDDGKGESAAPEVLIKKLVLTNLEAHASEEEGLTAGIPVAATVDRIELENVSTKGGTGGISQQLSAKLFEVTMQATVNAVGKQLPGAIASGVGKSLDGAGVAIGKTTAAITEGASKAVEGATKGLGGLFGGDKK